MSDLVDSIIGTIVDHFVDVVVSKCPQAVEGYSDDGKPLLNVLGVFAVIFMTTRFLNKLFRGKHET